MWQITVKKHVIWENIILGADEPPICVQEFGSDMQTWCHRVQIEEGELIYDPNNKPRLVIITNKEPIIID